MMAKQFGAEVSLVTKVGYDFPDEYALWLSRNQLNLAPESKSKKGRTTRFRIDIQDHERILRLLSRCEDLDLKQLSGSDAIIVSGIANEISTEFLERAKALTKFLFIDPQTIVRSFSLEGICKVTTPRNPDVIYLASAVKADSQEACLLTGKTDKVQAAKQLVDSGIEIVLITDKGEVLLATKGDFFSVNVRPSNVVDTTGAGDIFAGAFVASLMKSSDPVWACCVAASASTLAVGQIGISKVPSADSVIEKAETIRKSGIHRLSLSS